MQERHDMTDDEQPTDQAQALDETDPLKEEVEECQDRLRPLVSPRGPVA